MISITDNSISLCGSRKMTMAVKLLYRMLLNADIESPCYSHPENTFNAKKITTKNYKVICRNPMLKLTKQKLNIVLNKLG